MRNLTSRSVEWFCSDFPLKHCLGCFSPSVRVQPCLFFISFYFLEINVSFFCSCARLPASSFAMICHNSESTTASVFFSRWQIIATIPKFQIPRHNIFAAQLFPFCFLLSRSASQTHLMRNNGQTTESALIRRGCQIRGAPPPQRRAEILLCSNGEKQLSHRANSITACLSDVPAAAHSQRDRYEIFWGVWFVFCCRYLTETLAV